MRKIYILLKDTPELKKGAILREECDNGDQDFECINGETHQKFNDDAKSEIKYERVYVMKQPQWFQEVKMAYVLQSNLKKAKKYFFVVEDED